MERLIEYLFVIKESRFIEMAGILENDPRQPSLSIYDYVADEKSAKSATQLLLLAEEKLDAKKFDEAIELYTQLAQRFPTATHHALIGDCYWMQRKLEQANIHYREAIAVDPHHCGANHALGRNAVLQKNYQDGIVYLDVASNCCAGTALHAQNLRYRVEALLALDRDSEAQSDLDFLLQEYPQNADTYQAGILVAKKSGNDALVEQYRLKLRSITSSDSQ